MLPNESIAQSFYIVSRLHSSVVVKCICTSYSPYEGLLLRLSWYISYSYTGKFIHGWMGIIKLKSGRTCRLYMWIYTVHYLKDFLLIELHIYRWILIYIKILGPLLALIKSFCMHTKTLRWRDAGWVALRSAGPPQNCKRVRRMVIVWPTSRTRK